ncbi:MAG TPA: hypothetical protein VMW75_12315 [Thermoanaerobaculia bacterium]|nr:hypothetical protein [Thermoanaerobaculia bacterium]
MPDPNPAVEPQPESIRLAMDEAWRDHHHARDQTWKAVQMEAVIAAGLVTVDAQFHSAIATTLLAALVALSAVFGILISLHHREVEIRKLTHILHCQQALGLCRPDLINDVSPPTKLRLRDAVRPRAQSTAVFILRIHLAILFFALVVASARWVTHLRAGSPGRWSAMTHAANAPANPDAAGRRWLLCRRASEGDAPGWQLMDEPLGVRCPFVIRLRGRIPRPAS